MKKKFYPLSPVKGVKTPRAPVIAFLSVLPGPGGEYWGGSFIDTDGVLKNVAEPGGLIGLFKTLPDKGWVITYDLNDLDCLTGALLAVYPTIEQLNASSITIKRRGQELNIIDLRADFMDTLKNVCFKIGLEIPARPGQGSTQEDKTGYNSARARMIRNLYQMKDFILMQNFNCHPGRAPGATGLKTFTRKMSRKIKVRGKQVRKITEKTNRAPALHWLPGHYPQAYQYDINAAYPFVMGRMLYPEHLKVFSRIAPPTDRYIAVVKINYQTAAHFSPLTVQLPDLEKSLVHPRQVKNYRCTLTYIDIETLENFGDLEIVEWIEGVYWERHDEQPIFKEWAETIERISENKIDKVLIKTVSRALHSKFDQRGYTVTKIQVVKRERYLTLLRAGKVADMIELEDGRRAVKYSERHRPGFRPYYRPDIEALTLSAARALVYNVMDEDTIYIDTDCIISTRERDDLHLSNRFGDWKLQQSGFCTVSGPRLYAISEQVKASGISTQEVKELKGAIHRAVDGDVSVISATEKPFLFSGGSERIRAHTIQKIPYARAQVDGLRAYVTRSPTRLFRLKTIRRRLSRKPPKY